VYFKCELLQKSGSFKARGACNAVLSLTDEEAALGVCTHSSGNHAQALALAAGIRGIPAHIVMPSNSPAIKRRGVEGFGGSVIECAPTQAAREAAAAEIAARSGATFVHPSEDPRVIAGQGTIALELLAQVAALQMTEKEDGRQPPLDAIIVPVGGGGMISGIAIAAGAAQAAAATSGSCRRPVRIIGAEPALADDAARSLATGVRQGASPSTALTMADGLRTTLGPNTWPIVERCVERIVTVTEAEIASAMRLVYERLKLVIEPSAAVGVAALLSDEVRGLDGLGHIGVVLCGGNVDLDRLPWLTAPSL